jgi:uncharacterized protein YjlB
MTSSNTTAILKNSQTAQIQPHLFIGDGRVPNNPLPLLAYISVMTLPPNDPASAWEEVFAANGWDRSWRNGVYSFQHFHSTAHEVLGCYSGSARVLFGGEQGAVVEVTAGDAVLIPAGVGHKNLGASDDFGVVGAYPPGPSWDLMRAASSEYDQAQTNIAAVPRPPADPLYGPKGPLLQHWG